MDPVGHIGPALDLLRRQLAENIDRLRKSGKFAARAGVGAARSAAQGAPPIQEAFAARISGIERRSPRGREAITRVLVEVALLAEFGEGLLNDPAFGVMLDEISAGLREDAQIRDELDALIEEL